MKGLRYSHSDNSYIDFISLPHFQFNGGISSSMPCILPKTKTLHQQNQCVKRSSQLCGGWSGIFVWLMHICNVRIFYVIQNLIGKDPVHTAPSLLVAKVQRGHTISKRMVIKQYNIFTSRPEFSVVYLRLKYKIILISGTIYACKYSAW